MDQNKLKTFGIVALSSLLILWTMSLFVEWKNITPNFMWLLMLLFLTIVLAAKWVGKIDVKKEAIPLVILGAVILVVMKVIQANVYSGGLFALVP